MVYRVPPETAAPPAPRKLPWGLGCATFIHACLWATTLGLWLASPSFACPFAVNSFFTGLYAAALVRRFWQTRRS